MIDSNSPYGLHNYLYSRYYNNGNSSGGMLNDNVNANYGLVSDQAIVCSDSFF